MDDTALQFALREVQRSFSRPRLLMGMAVLAVLLGFTGPFETFTELSLPARITYWVVVVVATYALGLFGAMLAIRIAGSRAATPALHVLAVGLGASIPTTLAMLAINYVFFGEWPQGLGDLGVLWSYCAAIATGVGMLRELWNRDRTGRGVTGDAPSPAAPSPHDASAAPAAALPPLLQRLPLAMRGRLSHLSMQDHYVEVVTDRGRSLVLMRFSDAVKETGETKGMQVHRSHWVAFDAVARAARQDGRAILEMRNGDRLPVSRGFLPAAREAGLIG